MNEIRTKNIQDISIEGRLSNNMIFMLCDQIETLEMVAKEEAYKANFRWDKHTEMQLMKIKYAAKDMRKRTIETSEESQINFGDDSDKLLKLLLIAIDRTGNDNNVIDLIIKFAESFQSKMNLKLNKFGY